MAQIKSESDVLSRTARNFFKPSTPETILYALLGTILLLVYNANDILHKLSNNYIGSPEHIKTNFTTIGTSFSNAFSTALGGRLGQIIVWSFVGALVYLGLWLAKNILNSFENDIISDTYLHPSNYSRVGYWSSSISVKIFLAALLLVFIGYLFVVIKAIVPILALLAASAAYNFQASSTMYILFSIVAITLVIYITIIMLRLVSHLWKLL